MRSLLIVLCVLCLVCLTLPATAAPRDCPGCRVFDVPVEVVVKAVEKTKAVVKKTDKAISATAQATKQFAKVRHAERSAVVQRRPITRFIPLLWRL